MLRIFPAVRLWRSRSLAVALVVALGLPAAVAADMFDTPEDPWAGDLQQRQELGSCERIDPIFIKRVQLTQRAAAIKRLEEESAIPIDFPEVGRLGFATPPAEPDLHYERLLRQEIDRLQAKRRRGVEAWQGGWSPTDEMRLNNLVALAYEESAPLLVPFLVRAVTMDEAAGGFSAEICGDTLWVHNFALGPPDPPAARLPVVVYLARRPATVLATWATALRP